MDNRECLAVRYWVQKAVALFENAGKVETLARIADPEGPFIQDKRYVFALDIEGNLMAHPFRKELVGHNLITLRDCEGRNFVQKLLTTAQNRGYGFSDYKWQVPNSKDALHKTVFFERVDGIVLSSGFYTVKESPMEAFCKYFRPYGPA